MLHNKFEMPLDLEIKPSRLFVFYLFFIFFLAAISIYISALLLSFKLFLVVVLIVSMMLIIKKYNINRVTSIHLSHSDKWKIEVNNSDKYEAEIQGECIVTYFLIWLNFTTHNSFGRKKVFHVLLLPDSAEKDLLRQLRVRLRFLKNETDEDTELKGIL